MNDEEEDYWKFIRKTAARVNARPEWAKGAIDRPANIYLLTNKEEQEVKNKDCTCGVMRGIENGHNSTCPFFQISPRQVSLDKAVAEHFKKESASKRQRELIRLDKVKQNLLKELEEVNDEFQELAKRCNHRYPNGRNAIHSEPLKRYCKICYWDDLSF